MEAETGSTLNPDDRSLPSGTPDRIIRTAVAKLTTRHVSLLVYDNQLNNEPNCDSIVAEVPIQRHSSRLQPLEIPLTDTNAHQLQAMVKPPLSRAPIEPDADATNRLKHHNNAAQMRRSQSQKQKREASHNRRPWSRSKRPRRVLSVLFG